MCAWVRARLARARSPHSMSPTHFHRVPAPSPSAALAIGSSWRSPRPPPAGALLIDPRAHQLTSRLPVLGRLLRPPAARAAASAIAAPWPPARAPAPWLGPGSVNKVQYPSAVPGLGCERTRRGEDPGGASTTLGCPSGAPWQCLVYFMPNSPSWRFSQKVRRPPSIRPPLLLSDGALSLSSSLLVKNVFAWVLHEVAEISFLIFFFFSKPFYPFTKKLIPYFELVSPSSCHSTPGPGL